MSTKIIGYNNVKGDTLTLFFNVITRKNGWRQLKREIIITH